MDVARPPPRQAPLSVQVGGGQAIAAGPPSPFSELVSKLGMEAESGGNNWHVRQPHCGHIPLSTPLTVFCHCLW